MKSRNSPLHAKIKAALAASDAMLNRELAAKIGVKNPVRMGAVRYLVGRGELSEHPTHGMTRATRYSLPVKKAPIRTGYKEPPVEYDPPDADEPTFAVTDDSRLVILLAGKPIFLNAGRAQGLYDMLRKHFDEK